MKWFHYATITVVAALVGCRTTTEPKPARQPHQWRRLGSPVAFGDIEQLRRGLPDSLQQLADDLHAGGIRRQRAAYIVERLGVDAVALTEAVGDAFGAERDPVTQAYLARALAEIAPGQLSADAARTLRDRFRGGGHPVLRTYLAGAIACISTPKASQQEFRYLISSLDPSGSADFVTPDAREAFWERRWAAAYMVAKLGPEGEPMVPALEHLSDHPETPLWVQRQAHFSMRAVSTRR